MVGKAQNPFRDPANIPTTIEPVPERMRLDQIWVNDDVGYLPEPSAQTQRDLGHVTTHPQENTQHTSIFWPDYL